MAVVTSVVGVVQVGHRWRLYRDYSQALEAEAWEYLNSTEDGPAAYADFATVVCKSYKAFGIDYLKDVAAIPGTGTPSGQGTRQTVKLATLR